jgi:CheY-like chemotaxis protein
MKRILIVDDEQLILYGLSKTLHGLAEVKTVTTGREALLEVRSSFYDLCFLDMYLPDMSGLDVMKRVREISPETRVVIMTASHVSEDVRQAVEAAADFFIAKPFKLPQIKGIAKRLLEGRGTEDLF